jgi:hypothetical protein
MCAHAKRYLELILVEGERSRKKKTRYAVGLRREAILASTSDAERLSSSSRFSTPYSGGTINACIRKDVNDEAHQTVQTPLLVYHVPRESKWEDQGCTS